MCGGNQRDWDTFLVFNTNDGGPLAPYKARHAVEHFLISALGLTDRDRGGCNVNLLDAWGWEQYISCPEAADSIRIVEEITCRMPDALLPAEDDKDAWAQILASTFPDGTRAAISTVVGIACGRLRLGVWDHLDHTFFDVYKGKIDNHTCLYDDFRGRASSTCSCRVCRCTPSRSPTPTAQM